MTRLSGDMGEQQNVIDQVLSSWFLNELIHLKLNEDYEKIAQKLDSKAEVAYVTDCLLTKANKSELVAATSRKNIPGKPQAKIPFK